MALDSKEQLEEAKLVYERVKLAAQNPDGDIDNNIIVMILSGMLTETLLDYEEPDAIMEQSFYRIADFLKLDPMAGEIPEDEMPTPQNIDRFIEVGRKISKLSAVNLPDEMGDMHEIVIAIIIKEFPEIMKSDKGCKDPFRLMVEMVIAGLVFEMAVQEFCDTIIEDFIGEQKWDVKNAIYATGFISGSYLKEAIDLYKLDRKISEDGIIDVMVSEAGRNGIDGKRDWLGLGVSNDEGKNSELNDIDKKKFKDLKAKFEEFYEIVEMDDPYAKSTILSKSLGRLVAIVLFEEKVKMQQSAIKSIAGTGFLRGSV